MEVLQQLWTYYAQNGGYVLGEFYRHFLMSAYGVLFAAVVEAGPSFAYILQAEKFAKSKEAFIRKINESGRQLVVIDYSFDGSKEGMWRPQEIAAMKKSDGNRP